jgi:hypothetical protein
MQKISGQFLSLSLFIILLAFFVFLHSLSSFDTARVDIVTRSARQAFSAAPLGPEFGFDLAPGVPNTRGQGDTPHPLDAMESLFRSQIAGVGVRMAHDGQRMHVTTSAAAFEEALAAEAVPGAAGSAFRAMLVSLLQTDFEHAGAWRMELVLGTGGPPGALEADVARAAVVRVAQMAERLEVLGLPARLVAAGLGPEAAGRLDIYIRPYAPFDPLDESTGGTP